MSTQPAAPEGILASDGCLAAAHDLVIFDLDGVVYVGPDAVPGAVDTIEALRSGAGTGRPVPCCFLTNNASRTPDMVAEHLRELSIPARRDEVLTSAQVAAGLLAQRLPAGARVLVIGGTGLVVALREDGLVPVSSMDEEPAAVVQGFSPDLSWRRLAEAARAVQAGLFWVATNLDLTVPTPHGPAQATDHWCVPSPPPRDASPTQWPASRAPSRSTPPPAGRAAAGRSSPATGSTPISKAPAPRACRRWPCSRASREPAI